MSPVTRRLPPRSFLTRTVQVRAADDRRGMFESLTEYVSGSPWTYVFLFGIAAIDVLFPVVPSETSVILAGVIAGTGDLELVLVILFAGAGAVAGDNASYTIGRPARPWVIGRFIPGGRTAITLAAGLLEMPWRKFIVFDVAAGAVWASYAALLGYVGGRTFEENPLYGFLIAFAIALAVTGAVEAYRFLKKRGALARG